MSDEDNNLQVGIELGGLKHGLEQVHVEVRHLTEQVSHIVGALSTLTAKVGEYEAWRDSSALRQRAPSFTTESVELAMERANVVQSAANSESIKVAALEANKPVIAETIRQTKAVEEQTHVVATGIAQQTATLSKANKSGMVIMGVILGMWQVIQYLIVHH